MATSVLPANSRSDAAPAILAALVVLGLTLFSPALFNDGDTFWHVRAGEWMLDHRQVLTQDVFSATYLGKPWMAHEWLSEIVMALVYRADAWTGVALLFGAASGLTAFLLVRRLSFHLDGAALALVATICLFLLAPGLLARPHVLTWPFVLLWTGLLVQVTGSRQWPGMAWKTALAFVLMAAWANLHGGFLFGLALAGPFVLEALFETKGDLKARLSAALFPGLIGVAGLLGALCNPHGVEGVIFPLHLTGLPILNAIGEWRAPDFTRFQPLDLALAGLALALVTGKLHLSPVRLLLVLCLVALSLQHQRHQMLLGLTAPVLIAEPLGRAFARRPQIGRPWLGRALAAGLGLVTIGRLLLPVTLTDSPVAPFTALAHVPLKVRSQPVLNDYAFCGLLIFDGVKPYIDSRAELYGEAFLEEFQRLNAPDPRRLEAVLSGRGIGWTILSPDSPLLPLIDKRPGWRRLYADRFAVISARTP